ncbi:ABC transporter ATP-binding protein [Plantactinospora sp. KLBMP9567]|uniref:ABC transporter ATP-binding protein n=1 Tax=Plantactinospora sp. KLBMP9567 TaxID=3085900 RepID=UPI002981CA7F|nr:ABC transporter ATP-binding protein [Plantactinospora sp. KLBMP9567]MDW5327203.1 ABC transporter ATP-binding protein [Plantactinospora sp. KLBMP9567]
MDALKATDLKVARGEYVALIGPSGSGKSSLLNIIGLLDRPTQGTYLLDGRDVDRLSESARAAVRGYKIGFVFQAFHLLSHRTLEDNVALAMLYRGTPPSARLSTARAALHRVGLGHRSGALPTQLSGGERQRVAIARAVAGEPPLLLCDEPTGNLDSRTADSIMNLITDLHRSGLTIVMITHDLDIAARAGRVVSIRDGKVREGLVSSP